MSSKGLRINSMIGFKIEIQGELTLPKLMGKLGVVRTVIEKR